MATVPPADRTSPALDPRYDPVFQRGYSAERLGAPGPVPIASRGVARPIESTGTAELTATAGQTVPAAPTAPAEPDGLLSHGSSAAAPEDAAPEDAAAATPPPLAVPQRRLRTGLLWLVSGALVVAGVLLHFAFGAAGYGADWSVSTEGGAIRFADGRTVEQVLATDLVVTVAPYLVVLGIATAVATLFLQILRSEKGTI